MTTPADERAAVAYIAELYEIELAADYVPAVLCIGPYSAFILISALHLAARHPQLAQSQRATLARIVDQLRPMFEGTPGEALIRLGDDPANDIEQTGKRRLTRGSPRATIGHGAVTWPAPERDLHRGHCYEDHPYRRPRRHARRGNDPIRARRIRL